MTGSKQLGNTIAKAANGVRGHGVSLAVLLSIVALLLATFKPSLPTGEGQAAQGAQMRALETRILGLDETAKRLDATAIKLQSDLQTFSGAIGRLNGLIEAWQSRLEALEAWTRDHSP